MLCACVCVFVNCSLVKVQRIILTSGDALYYYLNTKFLFKTNVYLAFYGKLNEIDSEMFYNKSKVWYGYKEKIVLFFVGSLLMTINFV